MAKLVAITTGTALFIAALLPTASLLALFA